ncbi:MAG TPA: hypothetical protein VMJ32_08060 [Pirellulales bacterium]|nr:hypothetical protein [Pirellulales bacterium]
MPVQRSHRCRQGLTLVEMLISLVCVILLMFAYTQLFSDVGGRIGDARSMIELTNRMQSAAGRLRTDLAGHTCNMLPWQDPAAGGGYFEIIEGPLSDQNPGLTGYSASATYNLTDTTATPNTVYPMGDTDDVLMFTVRSKDVPFTGLYTDTTGKTQTVQSQVAEVVWFLRPTLLSDGVTPVNPPMFTLYRRVFLVMPTYQGNQTVLTGAAPTTTAGLQMPVSTFYQNNDISAHIDESTGTPVAVANTLGDLTNRECRFGHAFVNNAASSNGFPHRVYPPYLVPLGGSLSNGTYTVDTSNARFGQDVVLTNVISFDVQVWDPTAPVYLQGTSPSQVTVAPGDFGFTKIPGQLKTTPISPVSLYIYPTADAAGAFVDLNWAATNNLYSSYITLATTTTANAVGPCGKNVAGVNNGSIPLLALADCSTQNMSPFYSTGYPKSQLVAASPSAGPAAPTDFTKNWLFDDHLTSNLPDYGLYGYTPATFDTWSTYYEHDGLDQDGNGVVDQAASGFQDFANNTETSPPYPVALRGVKVTIRCYEPDSRQTHEISVVESFVPQ